MTNVIQIQKNYLFTGAAILLLSRTVSLTELGILSESRVGPTKRGRSSVKCRKKAGGFPTLQ